MVWCVPLTEGRREGCSEEQGTGVSSSACTLIAMTTEGMCVYMVCVAMTAGVYYNNYLSPWFVTMTTGVC